jgi:Tfp pilus assembly protein PilN
VRPVNLIPPEQRRGQRAPLRTGPLSYVLIGVLAVALAAISAVVLTNNQISDREAQISALEQREAAATARAESLRAFADFAGVSEARTATVTSLAQSRFDWERVLRELALVLPEDVWLVNLTGTVSPEVTLSGGIELQLRSEIDAPALSIVGCGESHEAVAGFIQALEDIDGVTRVGTASSELPEGSSSQSGSSDGDDCRTRDFIARFEIVVAFDAVQAPAVTAPAPTLPEPSGDDTGAAQEQEGAEATSAQAGNQQQDANVVAGVAR